MVSIVGGRVIMTGAVVVAMMVLVIAVLVGLVWTFQERIAFQPERAPFPDATGIPRVEYTAADGQPLFAYVIGDPQVSRGLVLVFHGNADLAVRQVKWAREIVRRTGLAVMITEYRGYMGLSGRPTYEGSKLDSEAAWRFATDTFHVPAERMIYFGHSLGTAIATELAMRHQPAGLLLQAPFTSARDMAALIVGSRVAGATWDLVSRLYFDTGANVAQLDIPVSVSHGGRDMVIPAWMGKKVFESAKIKGEWLFVPQASHGDLEIRGGDTYWQWVTTALSLAISSISMTPTVSM